MIPGSRNTCRPAPIAARGGELRKLRELAIFRLAEVRDQQRCVRAGAQQRDDLFVVQIADAGQCSLRASRAQDDSDECE